MPTKPDAGKPEGGGLGTIFSVIPTIYYDLIARVAPGLAFWLVLWLGTRGVAPLDAARSALEGQPLIVLVLSYLAGMLFTGLSFLWDALCFGVFWLVKPLRAPLGLDQARSFIQTWEVVARRMDEIGRVSEASGGIVTKALAEVAMTENLLTGLLLLVVIGLASDWQLLRVLQVQAPWVAAGALLLLATILFRQAMFLGRVKVLHRMHCRPRPLLQ